MHRTLGVPRWKVERWKIDKSIVSTSMEHEVGSCRSSSKQHNYLASSILTREVLQSFDACHSLRDAVPGHCAPTGHRILHATPFIVARPADLDATARHSSCLSFPISINVKSSNWACLVEDKQYEKPPEHLFWIQMNRRAGSCRRRAQ